MARFSNGLWLPSAPPASPPSELELAQTKATESGDVEIQVISKSDFLTAVGPSASANGPLMMVAGQDLPSPPPDFSLASAQDRGPILGHQPEAPANGSWTSGSFSQGILNPLFQGELPMGPVNEAPTGINERIAQRNRQKNRRRRASDKREAARKALAAAQQDPRTTPSRLAEMAGKVTKAENEFELAESQLAAMTPKDAHRRYRPHKEKAQEAQEALPAPEAPLLTLEELLAGPQVASEAEQMPLLGGEELFSLSGEPMATPQQPLAMPEAPEEALTTALAASLAPLSAFLLSDTTPPVQTVSPQDVLLDSRDPVSQVQMPLAEAQAPVQPSQGAETLLTGDLGDVLWDPTLCAFDSEMDVLMGTFTSPDDEGGNSEQDSWFSLSS